MKNKVDTKKKGYAVEDSVHDSLSKIDGCYVIGNTEIIVDGESAQIDNIVISPKAVYVIEIKSVRYSISGKVHDRLWTFSSTRGSGVIKPNPLNQNHKHIMVLNRLIAKHMSGRLPIVNIVLVGGNPRARIYSDSKNVCKLPVLRYQLIKDSRNPQFNSEKLYEFLKSILKEWEVEPCQN